MKEAQEQFEAYNQATLRDKIAANRSNYVGQQAAKRSAAQVLADGARSFVCAMVDDTFAAADLDAAMRAAGWKGESVRDALRLSHHWAAVANHVVTEELVDMDGDPVQYTDINGDLSTGSMADAINLNGKGATTTEELDMLADFMACEMALDRGDEQTVFGRNVSLADV